MKTITVGLLALVVFGLGLWLAFEQGRKLDGPQASISTLQSNVTSSSTLQGVEPSFSLFATLRTNL
jgi:hypothetical protein